MAWLSSTIVGLCMVVGSSKRISVDAKELASVGPSAPPVLSLEKVTEDMKPLDLLKVQRSNLYKKAWPTNCNGRNSEGDEIIGLSTDHFFCRPEGKIPELADLGWRNPSRTHCCCNKVCGDWQVCGGKKKKYTYTFEEAARAALSSAALTADHIVTRRGSHVQINVQLGADSDSVRAVVEVRMMDGSLAFKTDTAELTSDGTKFLSDLSESLGPLISMQVSSFEQEMKVLICPHAETSVTSEVAKDYVKARNSSLSYDWLPKARADLLKHALEKIMPLEVASVGEGIPHFKDEVPGYNADEKKRAFIIYKLYVADSKAPSCDEGDLHKFLNIIDRVS